MSGLSRFQGLRALVVGDLMVDEYVHGEATRISPEAPVMVVRQRSRRHVPGGAANVAFNLAALGADVALVGVAGADEAGRMLAEALAHRTDVKAQVVADPDRPTTRKTRVLADAAHQVLRVDHESTHPLAGAPESEVARLVGEGRSWADVVLVSDYRKGVVTATVVRATEGAARRIANAKPASVELYAGFDAVTLNDREAAGALGRAVTLEGAPEAARALAERTGTRDFVVTLGGQGLASRTGHVPARPVEVFDAAGAGDTTLATLALSVARSGGLALRDLELAAWTAAAVVRKVGVAVPSAEDLAEIERVFSAD